MEPRKSIKETLMQRDNISESEALSLIGEAMEQFQTYLAEGDTESAEDICGEYFGLEPDYLDEFM
jgi:hypothetical protein